MASTIRLSIDDVRVQRMFSAAPEVVSEGLRRLVEGAAIDLQRQERINAPVAVTGQLRGSIRYTFSPTTLTAEVMPEADYAEAVENGTRPHWVSVKPGTPLYQWARMKGINPYALQHSIARKGTKPHPFVAPTLEVMAPKIQNDFSSGLEALIGSLDHA